MRPSSLFLVPLLWGSLGLGGPILGSSSVSAAGPVSFVARSIPPAGPAGEVWLGRALFFDVRLSSTGTVSCATCHDPHDGRLDGFAIADPPGSKVRLRYEDICGACHEK